MDPHQESAERETAGPGEYLAGQIITRPELAAAVSRIVAE